MIVRNNLFINFNSSAVEASGATDPLHYPSANTTIAGNICDMTCVDPTPKSRTAIHVSADDAIVADNQSYVRGSCDSLLTAIRLSEPALNVNVHDNLVRNCGQGIVTVKGEERVAKVIDPRTFLRMPSPGGLPLDRLQPGRCRGWNVVWPPGQTTSLLVIEACDPETLKFHLEEPHAMKAGDKFEVIASSLRWTVHDNTVTGCLKPIVLDSYGSPTSLVRDNIVSRGDSDWKTTSQGLAVAYLPFPMSN